MAIIQDLIKKQTAVYSFRSIDVNVENPDLSTIGIRYVTLEDGKDPIVDSVEVTITAAEAKAVYPNIIVAVEQIGDAYSKANPNRLIPASEVV